MKRYKVNYRFNAVVAYAGTNHVFAAAEGDVIDLEDWAAGELAVQVPGALTLDKPAVKPVEAPAVVDVVLAEGLVEEAATRAVVSKKAKR